MGDGRACRGANDLTGSKYCRGRAGLGLIQVCQQRADGKFIVRSWCIDGTLIVEEGYDRSQTMYPKKKAVLSQSGDMTANASVASDARCVISPILMLIFEHIGSIVVSVASLAAMSGPDANDKDRVFLCGFFFSYYMLLSCSLLFFCLWLLRLFLVRSWKYVQVAVGIIFAGC